MICKNVFAPVCAILGILSIGAQAQNLKTLFVSNGGDWSRQSHSGWHRYWGGPSIGYYYAARPVYVVPGYSKPTYYDSPAYWNSHPAYNLHRPRHDNGLHKGWYKGNGHDNGLHKGWYKDKGHNKDRWSEEGDDRGRGNGKGHGKEKEEGDTRGHGNGKGHGRGD